MELRQLEYFVAVARHASFTRAADALWITQSALSQQVRRLEAELGVALLHRSARGAELTPAGEELLARAEAILGEVDRARAALDRHAGAVRGRVRVAATTGDAPWLPAPSPPSTTPIPASSWRSATPAPPRRRRSWRAAPPTSPWRPCTATRRQG